MAPFDVTQPQTATPAVNWRIAADVAPSIAVDEIHRLYDLIRDLELLLRSGYPDTALLVVSQDRRENHY